MCSLIMIVLLSVMLVMSKPITPETTDIEKLDISFRYVFCNPYLYYVSKFVNINFLFGGIHNVDDPSDDKSCKKYCVPI